MQYRRISGVLLLSPTSLTKKGRRISRVIMSLSAVLICFCFTIASISSISAQQMNSQTKGAWVNPYTELDRAAGLIKIGDDETQTRAFAEKIFNMSRSFPRMPAAVEDVLKDRLVRAEMAFRQGRGPGIQEDNIVQFVNSLAHKLNVPGYARTSTKQVRVLRMSLILTSPSFMGQGVSWSEMKIGDSIKPVMSPLQATHLILTLMDQKLINPEYQVPPEEWERTFQQSSIERLQAFQKMQQAGSVGKQTAQGVFRHNPKHRELRDAVTQGISSLTLADAFGMIDDAFKTLKIDQ